jgi:hypothetical protein
MGLSQLGVGLILIALFSIAIIGFAVEFAIDNNSPIDIADDSSLSGLDIQLRGNASQFSEGSEESYQSIIETTIDEGDVFPSSAPFATPKVIRTIFATPKAILNTLYVKIFGSESGFGVFLAGIVAIILFLMGLFIYKALRGIPD